MRIANQKAKIIEYLKAHKSISQGEAHRLGIFRLSARIMELRIAGYDISCEMIHGENEYGPYRYGRYTLHEGV